jgi:S-adenosylmethionine hydrolase
MPIVTLTTDFGTSDWFAGTMKGVVLGIAPRARIVDITHDVPSGDIRTGAFALAAACAYFPKGTIHVAIVDPGVGGSRAALAVKTKRFHFVGPDNGILSMALAAEKGVAAHRIENAAFMLQRPSRTFHGRDIFSPVAAHLACGVPITRLGPKVKDYVRLAIPTPEMDAGQRRGEVLHVDRFGNAITNIPAEAINALGGELQVTVARRTMPVRDHYEAVPNGSPVAVIGSCGFLEIAVNSGNAARRLGLKRGTRVTARQTRTVPKPFSR